MWRWQLHRANCYSHSNTTPHGCTLQRSIDEPHTIISYVHAKYKPKDITSVRNPNRQRTNIYAVGPTKS